MGGIKQVRPTILTDFLFTRKRRGKKNRETLTRAWVCSSGGDGGGGDGCCRRGNVLVRQGAIY